jgi:SAM-dependent methyltransferase
VPAALSRHWHAPAELREREDEWWRRHADLESRYTWVLPPAFEPPARRRYVDAIAAHLQGCDHVIDYGCGNGWLTRMLRQRLQAQVCGVDMAPTQIALARAHPDSGGIDFRVCNGAGDLPAADGYVFHGVLHHLSGAEIDELLVQLRRVARPGARAVIVEPVCFPGHAPDAKDRALSDTIAELLAEPAAAAQRAGVTPSPRIAELRRRAAERWWGVLPYGPSPLEKPFEHDELALLLAGDFDVQRHSVVQYLGGVQALGGELALLAEDAPDLAARLAAELVPQVDALERALLRLPRLPDTAWYLALLTLMLR